MNTKIATPLATALGLALFGTAAVASDGPLFALEDLGTGYQLASNHGAEGRCGEGKCGEGRCGMDKMDTDGDGRISQAEALAAGKTAEQFAAHDTDGDGYITQEEWDAAHAAGEGKCGEGKCGEGKCGGHA